LLFVVLAANRCPHHIPFRCYKYAELVMLVGYVVKFYSKNQYRICRQSVRWLRKRPVSIVRRDVQSYCPPFFYTRFCNPVLPAHYRTSQYIRRMKLVGGNKRGPRLQICAGIPNRYPG